MKVVIINKSDTTGGAAVVSLRLMYALRKAGVDARMIVVEKLHDSPCVERAADERRMKVPFLAERLKIFLANGMDRSTLFRIDTASDGLPLWNHRWVRDADVVCLNWVNQGMLSLGGIKKIRELGKPVVWTMHDMWCFTGVCHHAGDCMRFTSACGNCPLLGRGAGPDDVSAKVFAKKAALYSAGGIDFVAVSNWLASRAKQSALPVVSAPVVIPNAFPLPDAPTLHKDNGKIRIVFGAARLDDPVKGLPILVEATRRLKELDPLKARNMELITFGAVRNPDILNKIGINSTHLGLIRGQEKIWQLYKSADIVVSTSLYETLPGTLVEGQAYGCVPVAFNRGGQSDIVDHLSTGYLAEWDDSLEKGGENIANGIIWAAGQGADVRRRMYDSVKERFSESTVASRYISLFNRIISGSSSHSSEKTLNP